VGDLLVLWITDINQRGLGRLFSQPASDRLCGGRLNRQSPWPGSLLNDNATSRECQDDRGAVTAQSYLEVDCHGNGNSQTNANVGETYVSNLSLRSSVTGITKQAHLAAPLLIKAPAYYPVRWFCLAFMLSGPSENTFALKNQAG